MLTQNLVLDNAEGTDVTFNLQAYLPDGARRIDITSTPTEPRLLEIRHSTSGKGSSAVDRHLISSSVTKRNGAGVPQKGVVNLTFTVPQDVIITQSDIKNALAAILDVIFDGTMTSYTSTTNLSAILRGES